MGGVCSLGCTAGYIDDSPSFPKTRVLCKVIGKNDQLGTCQTACSLHYLTDANKVCQTCKFWNKYSQDGLCETKCGYGYETDSNNICQSFNPY